ncbi:Maf family protein [Tuberibacillus sp. Marseille-P3662]|uniref:Maf family protein n=1 Tax=Tuberibacillus sp. Marseille-P3662 TaxID=1965358 RepID=UPI000A1CA864|nr:Maf family protein [Tuberibacillus sp. Marseille-P3662]
MATLILASSSPRRRELIHTLGLDVHIIENDVDETISEHLSPASVAKTLALRKARQAYEDWPDKDAGAVVIGSDTVVALDDQILGKPADDTDACHMIGQLAGRKHEVYTAIAVIRLDDGKEYVSHLKTDVYMKPLSPERIKRYVATGESMDKAGAYGIQGLGSILVDRIDGDYFNVVGLPLSLLVELLKMFDIDVL